MAWPLLTIHQTALDHAEDFWARLTEGIATNPLVPRTESSSEMKAADHSALALVCSQAGSSSRRDARGHGRAAAATPGLQCCVMLRAKEEQCEREQAVH